MDQHRPALHRAILVVDVERFTDPARTQLHQLAVRDALYDLLKQAFAEANVAWQACTVEDRGDGAMILVPPDVPKSYLTDQLPHRMVAALKRCNAIRSEEARIRLRIAVHAGEVHHDDHGVAGTAVNLTFRLLDAPALREALAVSSGSLALIVSDTWFDDVVRQDPAAAPESYRSVDVVVKQTKLTGWIRLVDDLPVAAPVDAAKPYERSRAGSEGASPTDALFELVAALLAVPSVADETSRRLLLEQLPLDIAGAIPYHPKPRPHVVGIVRTCLDYDGGLAELLNAIWNLEGDSVPVRNLARTVATVGPRLAL